MISKPTVVGDKIFFGACSGNFHALEKSSATVLWTYDITKDGNQRSFHVNPAADQGIIYVGCDYGNYFRKQERVGHLYAFEQKTGALKWKHKVEMGIGSDPVFDDRDIFIVTVEDELLSLKKDSGQLNWSFKERDRFVIYTLKRLRFSTLSVSTWVLGTATFMRLTRKPGR